MGRGEMHDLRLFADFMKDFWAYIKKYWIVKDWDAFWSDGNAIWYRYGRDGLIRELMVVFMKSRE